jgi:hypothetical protein
VDQHRWETLRDGTVIPAHPLALGPDRRLDEDGQRALTRYYCSSGAGGVAVGVHTTQFEIRDPKVGLYGPVLELAAEELDAAENSRELVRVAGVCGPTAEAVAEAEQAKTHGYDIALVSMAGWGDASEQQVLEGLAAVGEVMPVFGFYLQPAVGGRLFSYRFWRRLAEIPAVRAIKIAAFDRYRTLDVVRAVAEADRLDEVALYTGNDDNYVVDLLTPFRVRPDQPPARIVGGLLGQWAVWTPAAVALHRAIAARWDGPAIATEWLSLAADCTDANGAIFDVANGFHGCIPGINEVLVREGLLRGRWCLDPAEDLSPGQAAEIDRVESAYPHLRDPSLLDAYLTAVPSVP